MARAKRIKPAAQVAGVKVRSAGLKAAPAKRASKLASATPPRPVGRPRKAAPTLANPIACKPVDEAPVAAAHPVTERVAKPTVAAIEQATKPVVEIAEAALPNPVAATVAAAEPVIKTAMKGPDMATATETLKKNGEASADRVQALFGDVNGRAKTALEKGTKLYEEMAEFAKGNVEALVASSRLAAKGAEALGQEAAEYGKSSFERASATFRSFATVRSPTELFKLQSDFARTAFDDMVAESSKLSESFLKLAGEIAQPLSSRVALTAEKVKSAAF